MVALFDPNWLNSLRFTRARRFNSQAALTAVGGNPTGTSTGSADERLAVRSPWPSIRQIELPLSSSAMRPETKSGTPLPFYETIL